MRTVYEDLFFCWWCGIYDGHNLIGAGYGIDRDAAYDDARKSILGD